jgi:large subunit ribosomal protein L15
MPLLRRLPKRGFRRLQKNAARRDRVALVNVGSLESFAEDQTVDPAMLVDRGLVRAGLRVKVLGDGELKRKITVRAHAFSNGAREKITALGGLAEVIEGL